MGARGGGRGPTGAHTTWQGQSLLGTSLLAANKLACCIWLGVWEPQACKLLVNCQPGVPLYMPYKKACLVVWRTVAEQARGRWAHACS